MSTFIPTPSITQQVQPVTLVLTPTQTANLLASIETNLVSDGFVIPTLPAGVAINRINGFINPDGSSQVMVGYSYTSPA